jgi:hypothetical protein
MRDHIRREAGQYRETVWWLVPVAFAVAALAAVAVSTNEPAAPPALRAPVAVVNMPNASPVTARVTPPTVQPASVQAASVQRAPVQPEPPTLEEIERVPTF